MFNNYNVEGSKINFLTLLVKSKAPENVLPLTADCWTNVGPRDVVLTGDNLDKLVLYGQAMQGGSPVIAADMRALVSGGSEVTEVVLRDDGTTPDSVKNDGIYSAYFTQFKPNQAESRHSLVCSVLGTEDTRVINITAQQDIRAFPSWPSASTPACCGSSAVTEDTPVSPTGVFSRSRSGGVITFGHTGSDNNLFPPASVRDLSLGQFDGDQFSLSFTSPGADLNTGTIEEFVIFYSTNKTLLDHQEVDSPVPRITTDDLAGNCSLDPLPPHERVDLTIKVTNFEMDQQFFFRVLAVDQTGEFRKTSMSNVASIFLNSPRIQCPDGWIDAQSKGLGCVNFFNDEVSLTWFEAHEVCREKYSGFLVEALSREEAEFLFQIAEMIQIYSSNTTWWIGLTDFFGR